MKVSGRGRGRVTRWPPGLLDIKGGGAYLLDAYVLTAENSYLQVMN